MAVSRQRFEKPKHKKLLLIKQKMNNPDMFFVNKIAVKLREYSEKQYIELFGQFK